MTTPTTIDEFRAHIAELQARPHWRPPAAFALGLATISTHGEGTKVLATSYPVVNLGENLGAAALFAEVLGHDGSTGTFVLDLEQLHALEATMAPAVDGGGSHPNAELLPVLVDVLSGSGPGTRTVSQPVVTFISDLSDPPISAHDVYLRLHLLSTRRIRPHGANLDGQFGLLANVVWTDRGPCDPDGFDLWRAAESAEGRTVNVMGVDKFPRMTDYVVPSGVRIADASRVRLGAHLAEGTTVMHEGFVNFNAGTLGNAMVEGRITAGVVVGADSDIGGGASIMGTLSGGGKEVITVGERCLLGANSGIGISLGDSCTVEAGLYLTAGTLVALPDGEVVKARELSGRSGLLFRRNSRSGAVEALAQSGTWTGLNDLLHVND